MAKKRSGLSAEGSGSDAFPADPLAEGDQPQAAEQRGSAPRKPAHKIRIGRIWGTIWENHHPETGRWFSVNLTRSYQDGQGQWKSASSFGRDDLLVVAEVGRLAFHWINEQFSNDGSGS